MHVLQEYQQLDDQAGGVLECLANGVRLSPSKETEEKGVVGILEIDCAGSRGRGWGVSRRWFFWWVDEVRLSLRRRIIK